MFGAWIVALPAAGTAMVELPAALAMAQLAVTLAVSVNTPPADPARIFILTVNVFVSPGAIGPMSFQVSVLDVFESAAGVEPRIENRMPLVAVTVSTTLTPVSVQACGLWTLMM